MSSSEANIPTYYTIDSEITVESGWTVKEFFVPEEGIIKMAHQFLIWPSLPLLRFLPDTQFFNTQI
jgi:hypothetical protein